MQLKYQHTLLLYQVSTSKGIRQSLRRQEKKGLHTPLFLPSEPKSEDLQNAENYRASTYLCIPRRREMYVRMFCCVVDMLGESSFTSKKPLWPTILHRSCRMCNFLLTSFLFLPPGQYITSRCHEDVWREIESFHRLLSLKWCFQKRYFFIIVAHKGL